MTPIYILLSTIALAWVASFWSSKDRLNMLIKAVFIVLAAVGAICTAAAFHITA